jgi:hypothetical protein
VRSRKAVEKEGPSLDIQFGPMTGHAYGDGMPMVMVRRVRRSVGAVVGVASAEPEVGSAAHR